MIITSIFLKILSDPHQNPHLLEKLSYSIVLCRGDYGLELWRVKTVSLGRSQGCLQAKRVLLMRDVESLFGLHTCDSPTKHRVL